MAEVVTVTVAVGVAVGGKTICVTKLQASKDKIKSPKRIRLIFIHHLINHEAHCNFYSAFAERASFAYSKSSESGLSSDMGTARFFT